MTLGKNHSYLQEGTHNTTFKVHLSVQIVQNRSSVIDIVI